MPYDMSEDWAWIVSLVTQPHQVWTTWILPNLCFCQPNWAESDTFGDSGSFLFVIIIFLKKKRERVNKVKDSANKKYYMVLLIITKYIQYIGRCFMHVSCRGTPQNLGSFSWLPVSTWKERLAQSRRINGRQYLSMDDTAALHPMYRPD